MPPSVEMEHKALWALKCFNINWMEAVQLRLGQLNEMDEFCLGAYKKDGLYKEGMKNFHN